MGLESRAFARVAVEHLVPVRLLEPFDCEGARRELQELGKLQVLGEAAQWNLRVSHFDVVAPPTEVVSLCSGLDIVTHV